VSQQYKTLDKGIWRWPRSSTPDKGGNTVFIGHRFTYTNPRGVFYFLNKIKLSDEIGVFWNNKKYLYKVTSVSQVPPNDTAIEDNTPQPELTLFTCTPLWLPKDRLVIVANLEATPCWAK
jgi:sortase A